MDIYIKRPVNVKSCNITRECRNPETIAEQNKNNICVNVNTKKAVIIRIFLEIKVFVNDPFLL